MEMYHVPVGREEKRERWDPMTSLKATWTLMNVPHAMVVKGDNCVVGPEGKVNQDFGIPKGGERGLNTPTREVVSCKR